MSMRDILVFKFGGTSMKNRDAIARVIEIVNRNSKYNRIVTVVSAMSGVTDSLLEIGQNALLRRKNDVDNSLIRLQILHSENFKALTEKEDVRKSIDEFLEAQFSEIRSIAEGVYLLREFSDRTREKLSSYGEILSSVLLARVMNSRDGKYCHSDARDWIVAQWTAQGSIVDMAETEHKVGIHLMPLLKRHKFPIVPGFVCRTTDGKPATLGRNGSDYSAAIVGGVLRAKEILIYTDVEGVMTADPNLVAEATVLPQISYAEAAEMSYFGAKVLHPKTLVPAIVYDIPIRIKSTFNDASPGTLITSREVRNPMIKTVTSVRDLTLLNLLGNGMIDIPRVASRLFDVMAVENVNVMMISQSSSEHSISMLVPSRDANRAIQALRSEFQSEIQRDLIEDISAIPKVAFVSVIGTGMRGAPGTSGKFFEALGKCRINVLAIAQGSSELNISAAILEKDSRHAVRAIHSAFGLTKDLNVFMFGCGRIGRTLIKQIHENRSQIAKSLKVNLKVLGVINTKTIRFSPLGINGSELEELSEGLALAQLHGAERRPEFAEEALDRVADTFRTDVVLVDATGAELAPVHIAGLQRGFHIVTANKKPLTGSMADYLEIQKLRKGKGLNYQYEATFGAGLPLLSTLQDLINTGDQIISVEGCLSGTLGLICSRLDAGKSLSEAVTEAMQLGFTEPDPRDDLSGVDVARKSLIIARELGIYCEPAEVKLKPFIPKSYFRAPSVESFLSNLSAADARLAEEVRICKKEGKALRYVVDIGKTNCNVGLKKVPLDSPIGRLAGPDNILVFKTRRYYEHPLVIQGPGAGASVTAAGVLSDLLKIAKWI
jgi:bifunctional aspartokinase / homoserine dehydrogenase 1